MSYSGEYQEMVFGTHPICSVVLISAVFLTVILSVAPTVLCFSFLHGRWWRCCRRTSLSLVEPTISCLHPQVNSLLWVKCRWSALTGECASRLRDGNVTDEICTCFLLCWDLRIPSHKLHCLKEKFGRFNHAASLLRLPLACHFRRRDHIWSNHYRAPWAES